MNNYKLLSYKVQFLSKVESFVKRMRWKALQFLGNFKTQQKESYGFHSRNCPLPVEELAASEEDLRLMIKISNLENIELNNEFQTKSSKDIKKIKNSKKKFSLMLANQATLMKWPKKNMKNIYWKMLQKFIRISRKRRIPRKTL